MCARTVTALTRPDTGDRVADGAPEGDARGVGVATRAVSWTLDAIVINVVATLVGAGTALVLSIFPLGKHAQPAFKLVAGGVYVIWCAAYFVAFWSTTGQTIGARIMRIRLLTPARGRVRVPRALIRWIGMNLAMLPLFAGYVPILFGRRGFPDWLAHTSVIDAPQDSLAVRRRASSQRSSPSPNSANRARAFNTSHGVSGSSADGDTPG